MRARVVEVVTGSQLWFEGELVEVRELRSDTMVLQTGGALRTVPAREVLLTAAPLNVDPESADSEPAAATNIVLSNLTLLRT